MSSQWDPERYDRQFGFVARGGEDVVQLLDPRPGETIVDLGCGTGSLTEKIRAAGADVVAIDADPAMVVAASERLGQPAVLGDGHDFTVAAPVDAVFSNAALHWMPESERVVAAVHRALRPGGRFVAEMGAARNIDAILTATATALGEIGLRQGMRTPWYFPTPAQYSGLLEAAGFRVASMAYFPRPTSLAECPDGIADWLAGFGSHLIGHVSEVNKPTLLRRINQLAAPVLYRDGQWHADYWRLRFVAVAE